MKKKYFATCIFLILFLFTSISLSSAPQEFILEGKVDVEIVKFIAQKMAEATWGKCSIGPMIECLSADGNLSSYLVVLRLGTMSCPSHEEILLEIDKRQQDYQNINNSIKSIKNEKQNIQQILQNARRKFWGVGEYCTVVVSANYEGFPAPRFFEGLPAYYVNFNNSKNTAENIIGRSQFRVDYYNLGHGGEFFLYTDGVSDLLIDAYSLKVNNEGENFLIRQLPWEEPNEEVKNQISEAWSYWLKLYQEKFLLDPSLCQVNAYYKYITHEDWVPVLLATRGCSPTAAAMAIGYWDNHIFNGVGGYCGYGRLIDYWLNQWEPLLGKYRNIPNLLNELAVAMYTNDNGDTDPDDIGPGIVSVANDINHYSFYSNKTKSYLGSGDWCWPEITAQVDSNLPFVWTVMPWIGDGHSLCAIGYAIINDIKYVAVYDGWGPAKDIWQYNLYDNNKSLMNSQVDTVV